MQKKQLGFIGDYYRLKAVYEYGGIYLDTDVKVYKSFDPLLDYPAFLNFIFDCSVGSAIIGARKGNPLIKALLDMYDNTTFGTNRSGKVFEWRDGKAGRRRLCYQQLLLYLLYSAPLSGIYSE